MQNYCHWCHQADDFTPPSLADKLQRPPQPYPECGREIVLINVRFAAKIAQAAPRTIYHWIEIAQISTVQSSSQGQLVCYSSLFLPPSLAAARAQSCL